MFHKQSMGILLTARNVTRMRTFNYAFCTTARYIIMHVPRNLRVRINKIKIVKRKEGMEKDLRCSHNPIDLDWSDGCAVDPHCGISLQRRMASLWKRWVAESAGGCPASGPAVIQNSVWCRLPGRSNLQYIPPLVG